MEEGDRWRMLKRNERIKAEGEEGSSQVQQGLNMDVGLGSEQKKHSNTYNLFHFKNDPFYTLIENVNRMRTRAVSPSYLHSHLGAHT